MPQAREFREVCQRVIEEARNDARTASVARFLEAAGEEAAVLAARLPDQPVERRQDMYPLA